MLEDDIATIAADANEWLLQAQKLKEAADLIAAQIKTELRDFFGRGGGDILEYIDALDLFGIYLMVAGYAIENLAKARIVQHDSSRETIAKLTRRHLSAPMLRDAGVELDRADRDFVDRLRHRIIWAGRYPVPHAREAREIDERVRTRADDPRLVTPRDFDHVDQLFAKLWADAEHAAAE